MLLIGDKNEHGVKGAIHIASRWNKVIIDYRGRVMVESDYGSFQHRGRIRLARFTSEQTLGLYNDAPIQSQCSAENSLGFALGSWCEGTELDGLNIWYYVEGSDTGTPIEGYPGDMGLGVTMQYNLANTTSELYVGGVAPTV